MRLGDITQLRMKNPDSPLILNLLREIELLTSANRLLQKRIDELKSDLAIADGRPRKSRSPKRSPNLTKSPTNPEDQN